MRTYTKPRFEVADIINQYGESYKASNKLSLPQLKTINAIQICRTKALGGHLDKCSDCGYERNSYNSCRNRHCPKCQGLAQLKWIEKRKSELLPISYFHLVFTIPSELNRLTLVNQKLLYGILFKASSETINMLSLQQKHLGAKPGIISILHTWGQNLIEHPHVHILVTGGGVSAEGNKWVKSGKKFFLPVRVMSAVFRGKFLALLKQAYKNENILFEGEISAIKYPEKFNKLIDSLYKKQWVVYAKKTFGNASKVMTYLGRYTHRVAISNHRILSVKNEEISFKWKDYSDDNKTKIMNINAHEFIRRFLLHVLPSGFFKIRYYGLLSSRNKKNNLVLCCKLLGVASIFINQLEQSCLLLMNNTGVDVSRCPKCINGHMKIIQVMENSTRQ